MGDRLPSSGNPDGFTLIELLVVIGVIAVLLAILIPVTRAVRERAQRMVCLNNLRQLTTAWIAYADQHDGMLAHGCAFGMMYYTPATVRVEGWVGAAFDYPTSRTALLENPAKGPLWPYLQDIDVYRCPRGRAGHAITYATVVAANNTLQKVEGTYVPGTGGLDRMEVGQRVGSTVLRLTKLTDITSPGPAARAVFIDRNQTPMFSDFYVHYTRPAWAGISPPPIPHTNGATLSMADGHAEFWQWKGRETLEIPRTEVLRPNTDTCIEVLAAGDYEVQTEDGLSDLQRLQRATWGRLGYPVEEDP